ncbi:putative ABC transporter permease subunit [Deinococcus navajonensis]|uniref:ABC-2 type transport system permease protein n=1 Tax=Deinococcus navajonensis TaxID=309884 RepID=A0ABV8XT74_9DEIO
MRRPGTPANLLGLKATALRHALQKASRGGLVFLGLLGALLLWGEVYGAWRALNFLGRFGDIGTNVFARVLEIGLITLCSGVTFSATTAAIQTLYLSDDLNFLLTQPLPTWRVFALKVFETFLTTALVPVALTLPLLVTVGVYFHAPAWAYLVMAGAALLTFAAPVGLGALLAVGLMRVAPVGRVREVSTALGVLISAGLVYAIRALRPELLVQQAQDPARFEALLRSFAGPSSPLLPPSWAAQGIWQAAHGTLALTLLPLGLLTGALLLGATLLASRAYQEGWARALDSSLPRLDPTPRGAGSFERSLARLGAGGSLAAKDLRVTLRDPTQWSQLLVVVALAGVYLVSVRAVPIPVPQFRGILGYVQLAFQGFIIAGVAVRLAFPAVSTEARAYWLLRTAPVSPRQIVLSKFWGVLPVTLVLGLVMGLAGARSMNLGPTLVLLSALVSVSNAFVITALGVGLGAMAPRFDADNPAEIGVSAGGLAFMGLSLLYSVLCLLLLARPAAASVLRPELYPGFSALGTPEGILGLLGLAVATGLGTGLSLRQGWCGLDRLE